MGHTLTSRTSNPIVVICRRKTARNNIFTIWIIFFYISPTSIFTVLNIIFSPIPVFCYSIFIFCCCWTRCATRRSGGRISGTGASTATRYSPIFDSMGTFKITWLTICSTACILTCYILST